MMKIVLDAGYSGVLGVEYEGSKLSEYDGIMATKTARTHSRRQRLGFAKPKPPAPPTDIRFAGRGVANWRLRRVSFSLALVGARR